MRAEVVIFRPLWSLFVNRTERWLSRMADSGYRLRDVRFKKSLFIFEQREPEKVRFCLCYRKFAAGQNIRDEHLLAQNGWERLRANGRWSLYQNPSFNGLGVMPNRRGLYLRNNSLLCAYSVLSFLVLLAALAASLGVLLLHSGSTANASAELVKVLILGGVFVLLILLNFVLFLMLSFLNNTILQELDSTMNPEYALYRHYVRNQTFEKWLEKRFVKDGDIIKRFWPFWRLSPDRLQKRLEAMDENGLHFYKAEKLGTIFYFVKGKPRRMVYRVVSSETSSYDDTVGYLELGWNIAYATSGQPQRIFILSKQEDTGSPMFFSDKASFLRNARKIARRPAAALSLTLLFWFLLLLPEIVFRIPVLFPQTVLMLLNLLLFVKILLFYGRAVAEANKFFPVMRKKG